MVEVIVLFLKTANQFVNFNKRNEISYSNIEQITRFFSNVSPKIEEFSELPNEFEEQFLDY